MSRDLIPDGGGSWLPAALLLDTSAQRIFNSPTAPVPSSTLLLARGDLWNKPNTSVSPGTTYTRPAGPGYVRYEDLRRPGDTVSQAMARLGASSPNANPDGTGYITFPEGVFACTDFYGVPGNTTAQDGIYVPHNALGIIGSGPGVPGSTDSGTIFTIVPNSSTVPKIPQQGSGGANNLIPNSCLLMYHGTGTKPGVPYLYGQFQVIGTPQQNTYHGFTVHNPAGPVHMFDLIGFGGYCDNGSPPGETFIISASGGNGPHLFERIYCDGNNTGGGFSLENMVNAVCRDITSMRSNTHPFVLYQSFRTKTFDVTLGPGSPNSTVHGGVPTFNHERTSGSVHTRLKQVGVNPNVSSQIIHSNDTYTATIDGIACSTVDGSLTLIDVSGVPPAYPPYIQIESGHPYNTSGFNGDTMSTPPLVVRTDGVTHVPYRWYRDSLGTTTVS